VLFKDTLIQLEDEEEIKYANDGFSRNNILEEKRVMSQWLTFISSNIMDSRKIEWRKAL